MEPIIGVSLELMIFIVTFFIALPIFIRVWEWLLDRPDKVPNSYLSYKEIHEKYGTITCSNCGKRFIQDYGDTTDVVCNLNHPENLTETWAYCPHCHHSQMISYTPLSSIHMPTPVIGK